MNEKKIKVAFIFRNTNIFLSGSHFDNTYYHFFMDALKRNDLIQVSYFATDESFDASILRSKFDIILLFTNERFGMPDEIFGIDKLSIPVISMASDPNVSKKNRELHEKWKIDYYFHFLHESFFYELYPRHFKYRTIFFGIEPSLYQHTTPFEERIKNRILNTGAVGNPKIFSKLISHIRSPKWNPYKAYNLRAKCNKLSYVDYTSTLKHEFVNDKYPQLLQKYSASIAATTYTPNMKYWENAAAGCLTFMEITELNRGKYLGFLDKKTAIFINKKNYKTKFEEFLNDADNPKWKNIALEGQHFALHNFTNDIGVAKLVALMEELI